VEATRAWGENACPSFKIPVEISKNTSCSFIFNVFGSVKFFSDPFPKNNGTCYPLFYVIFTSFDIKKTFLPNRSGSVNFCKYYITVLMKCSEVHRLGMG